MARDGLPGSDGVARAGARLFAQLVLMAGFWAGTIVVGRALADDVGPFSLAFVRFAFATLFMTAWVLLRRAAFAPTSRQAWGLAFLALTGVFAYNALFFYGLRTVPATRAALIIAVNPAFTAAIAALFLGESMRAPQAAGVLLSLVGAATVIVDGDFSALLRGDVGIGEIALLGAVASWIAFTLAGKRVVVSMEPMAAIWLSGGAGAAMLALPAFLGEDFAGAAPELALDVWAGAAFMGIFASGLAAMWYYDGIRRIGAARAANFIYLVPPFVALLDFVFLGERLTLPVAAGGAAVIAGVWLAQRPARGGKIMAPSPPNPTRTP